MNLLELYTSVQGEGPNVGKFTTFVRFGGCNMRCPGWPCDTPYSIYPEQWKKEVERLQPVDVMNKVLHEVPRHVCITGGEPLIQPADQVHALMDLLDHAGFTVDIFTNGSRDLGAYGVLRHNTTIIMDWKLPGSGEGDSFKEARLANLSLLREQDAIKLVCKDLDDLYAAERFLYGIGEAHSVGEQRADYKVYVGVAWGTLRERDLLHWMSIKKFPGVYLNTQVHKYIFNPDMRRI